MGSQLTEDSRGFKESQDLTQGLPGGRVLKGITLSPGALLAGRYKILRFIARGGMGEVYEAEDLELREHVALKVLSDRPGDPASLERFRREIQLARKVTHGNVCRIFDVGFHREAGAGAQEEAEEITFLTMELLHGETLARRLRERKRMPVGEALPIARQLLAALGAAHAAGVIHRDLKAENVFLEPARSGERVVVTDFGLAHADAPEGSGSPSVSSAEEIVGTPAYMAPEQVERGTLSPATDIYALGVLLYEMVTGLLPFRGDSPFEVAVHRLTTDPASPREHIRDLDPRWEATILRCLRRNPADRFQSASEVLESLEGRRISTRKKVLLGAVLALVVLGCAAGLLALVGGRNQLRGRGAEGVSRSPRAAPGRKSVAVLWFKNLSGRPDENWLSTALSEMITTELSAGQRLRTLPGEEVARTRLELALPDSPSFAAETLARIRGSLGADCIVLGAFTALGLGAGGQIRLDLRVQDTSTGEMVDSFTVNGTEAGIFDMVARAGAHMREKLGAGAPSPAQLEQVRNLEPPHAEGARLYAQGLDKLRTFDFLSARELLEKAVAASPEYPLAHAALSEALSRLGYREKAAEEARRAFDLSSDLPAEERLIIEGRYREANSEWDKASEIYRSLWTFFPDSLEYGLRLASTQISGTRTRDALLSIAQLRKLSSPSGEDPRVDLTEAAAYRVLSDFPRSLSAAERAVVRAKKLGARMLLAQALLAEGSALRFLGETAKAIPVLEEGGAIYGSLGDLSSQAVALRAISLARIADSDIAGYEESLAKGIEIYRKIGDKAGLEISLQDLAHALAYGKGDLNRARPMAEESVRLCRELGDETDLSPALWKLGNILFQQGDLSGAGKAYGESLALAEKSGDALMVAYSTWGLGETASASDDLAGAWRRFEDSLAVLKKVQAAEARLWESLTRMRTAQLRLDQGRPEEAEREARKAVESLGGRANEPDSLKSAMAWLCRALIAGRKVAEARAVFDRAAAIRLPWPVPSVTIPVQIARADLLAGEGKAAEAKDAARNALAEAARYRILPLEYESRLALGRILPKAGSPSEGRVQLSRLEREARARGWLLIARKARTSSP